MSQTSLPPVHNPMSRMQLLSIPLIVPGKCAVCGSPNRPVVDFGMTLEFYGAVYLCQTCMTEGATLFGMVTATEFARAQADSSASFDEQLKTREMRAITNEQYNALVMAVGLLSDVILFSSADDVTVVAGPDREEQSSLFGDSGKESESDTGSPKQDDNAAISEGSSSVSSSNKHGSSFDF